MDLLFCEEKSVHFPGEERYTVHVSVLFISLPSEQTHVSVYTSTCSQEIIFSETPHMRHVAISQRQVEGWNIEVLVAASRKRL